MTVLRHRPRNVLEWEVCKAFSQHLDKDKVLPADNFFDLGGTSLQAVLVTGQLREKTGSHVPLNAIFGNPTPETLAAFLQSEMPHALEWPLAIPMANPDSSDLTIFAFPGPSGDPFGIFRVLRGLARCKIVGVRSPGREIGETTITDKGLLSIAYAQACEEHASGTNVLIGYCVGGLLAVETARQLEATGCAVQAVIMVNPVDPRPIGELQPPHELELAALDRARRALGLSAADPDLRNPYKQTAEELVRCGHFVPDRAGQWLKRWAQVYCANTIAAMRPPEVASWRGRLHMVFPADSQDKDRWESIWREKVDGEVSVDTVDGDQPELVDRPLLPEAIQRALALLA